MRSNEFLWDPKENRSPPTSFPTLVCNVGIYIYIHIYAYGSVRLNVVSEVLLEKTGAKPSGNQPAQDGS